MPALVSCCERRPDAERTCRSTPARVASVARYSNAAMILGPAVGIPRVVERVHADDDALDAPSTSAQPSASESKIVLRAGT